MNQAYEDLWSYHKPRLMDLGFDEREAGSIVGFAFKQCGHDATRTRDRLEKVWNGDPSKEDFWRYLRQQLKG